MPNAVSIITHRHQLCAAVLALSETNFELDVYVSVASIQELRPIVKAGVESILHSQNMEPLSVSYSDFVVFLHPGIRAILARAAAAEQQNLRQHYSKSISAKRRVEPRLAARCD